ADGRLRLRPEPREHHDPAAEVHADHQRTVIADLPAVPPETDGCETVANRGFHPCVELLPGPRRRAAPQERKRALIHARQGCWGTPGHRLRDYRRRAAGGRGNWWPRLCPVSPPGSAQSEPVRKAALSRSRQ